ncbi:MAG: FecR domain-containing protein [Polyangia bacterium]
MRRLPAQCRRARRDLLAEDRLDAVGRGRLELHLRRCPQCRSLAEGLARVESGGEPIEELSAERARKIYDRLLPAVHHLAVEREHRPTGLRRFAALAWSVGALAAAAALVVWIAVGENPNSAGEASAVVAARSPAGAEREAVETSGVIDRSQGSIRVDGRPFGDSRDRFPVTSGTRVALDEGSSVAFRLGDTARVALAGESEWRVERSTETLVEMMLERGKLAIDFDGRLGRMLDVRTPDSLVRVRGTLFTVEVAPDSATRIGVLDGHVEVVPLGRAGSTVELSAGDLAEIPSGRILPLGDEQRALAAEIDVAGDTLASRGRLVRFEGSPEKAIVELEGRVVGTTPLAIRIPEGEVSYRLSAPGMEPLVAELDGNGDDRKVSFALAPEVEYLSVVEEPLARPLRSRRIAATREPDSRADAGRSGWSLLQRARAAITAGDIPYAINLLRRNLQHAEENQRRVALFSLLAECYAAAGRYGEAADAFDRVAAAAPGTEMALNSRYEVGRLSMDRMGDFSRARAAFTSYLAAPTRGALREEAYYSLCEIDGREGSHRDALHCFNEFLRAFPGGHHEADARLWRGALLQDVEKKWGEAERDLIAFVRAKPRHPRAEEARYRVALGRFQAGDRRGSLRMVDQYLEQHPEGRYHLRVERLRRAILDPSYTWSGDSR